MKKLCRPDSLFPCSRSRTVPMYPVQDPGAGQGRCEMRNISQYYRPVPLGNETWERLHIQRSFKDSKHGGNTHPKGLEWRQRPSIVTQTPVGSKLSCRLYVGDPVSSDLLPRISVWISSSVSPLVSGMLT